MEGISETEADETSWCIIGRKHDHRKYAYKYKQAMISVSNRRTVGRTGCWTVRVILFHQYQKIILISTKTAQLHTHFLQNPCPLRYPEQILILISRNDSRWRTCLKGVQITTFFCNTQQDVNCPRHCVTASLQQLHVCEVKKWRGWFTFSTLLSIPNW